jgi:2-polyprenyl-3-methyl-5-hydroxy-6-metoxy-1,4-benzoquinol methylase
MTCQPNRSQVWCYQQIAQASHVVEPIATYSYLCCCCYLIDTGERGDAMALDLGCAVGGAAFELARAFPAVLGIDYSHAFVEAAQVGGSCWVLAQTLSASWRLCCRT